jgi:ComF family protein
MNDFVGLFFPKVCLICGNSLFRHEKVVCTKCFLHFPETGFQIHHENPVSRLLWGRIPMEAATALYYYRKKGSIQKLIRLLKYNGHREVGLFLGHLLGDAIGDDSRFHKIETIIPVPLHPKKLKVRGYNQAALIAEGMSEVLKIPVESNALIRKRATATQTKKTRYTRWENVSDIFQINPEIKSMSKHILIVDDVITTGATMEACLQELSSFMETKLYAAAVAFSEK